MRYLSVLLLTFLIHSAQADTTVHGRARMGTNSYDASFIIEFDSKISEKIYAGLARESTKAIDCEYSKGKYFCYKMLNGRVNPTKKNSDTNYVGPASITTSTTDDLVTLTVGGDIAEALTCTKQKYFECDGEGRYGFCSYTFRVDGSDID